LFKEKNVIVGEFLSLVKNRTFFLLGLILVLVLNISVNQGVIEGYKPELDIYRPYLGEQTNERKMNPEKGDSDELSLINTNKNLDEVRASINYVGHDTFKILNNSAFGPTGYNFPGNGTANDPYMIEAYNITDSSTTLIHIENTTAYFVIQDCLLDGINKIYTGIFLKNVTQGTIYRNVMYNNGHAIDTTYSENNSIIDNQIQDSGVFGILFTNSINITIKNNWINHTANTAIYLYISYNSNITDNEIQNSAGGISVTPYSNSIRIYRNTITDLSSSGIAVGSDSRADIRNNTISNIEGYGVVLSWHTHSNNIFGNIISNTSLASIRLSDTSGSAGYYGGASISNNTILNSKLQGILLTARNKGVIITRNTIFNSTGYAIEFHTNSNNNEVKWNSFFHNNGGDIQAFDNGENNVFEYNHWNDHISPDVDVDGVIDTIYQIDSTGGLRLTGTTSSYMITNPVGTFASDNLTVELWMKSFNNNKNFGLVSYANVSDNDFLFAYDSVADELDIYVRGNSVNTGCALSENVWTHLVVTWRSSDGNITLWKDGILKYTGILSTGLTLDIKGSLVLGQDQDVVGGAFGDGSQSFDGILDEVRILTSVLNQSEIQADNNSLGSYPARDGTIAWYHLDDTGTTASDSAGGVGAGTVVGGEWVDGVIIKNNFDLYSRIAPIWINSDDDFTNFSSSGNGSINDPYIIEDYQFISNQTNLIEIYNTTAYFIIKNSILNGLEGSYDAIYFNNVTNGAIMHTEILFTYYGIRVDL
jgi:parallel beta-helix repeat protein